MIRGRYYIQKQSLISIRKIVFYVLSILFTSITIGYAQTEVVFHGCNDFWANESSLNICNDNNWCYWAYNESPAEDGYITESWGNNGCGTVGANLFDGDYTLYLNDIYGDGGLCGYLEITGQGIIVENFCAQGGSSSA